MNKYLNKIGFFLLILFFMLVPIHFWSIEKISYFYKEFFALIFLLLTVPLLNQKTSFHLRSELFYLLCFTIYTLLHGLLIESRLLYSDIPDSDSYDLSGNIYVIRNILIYLPMLIYVYKRGLTIKEINFLMKVISVFGIISIIAYLRFYEISADLESALKLFALGGFSLSYNSFVPYLTFPFISSIYLVLNADSRINKIFYFIIAFLIFSYIVISTSRQSIIFCLIALLIYASFNKKIFKKVSVTIVFILILSSLILPVYLSDIEVSEKLISKTTSLQGLTNDETNRFETIKEGLFKLSDVEFLIGAGLSSVVTSGPHNDFVRWIQRVGIIGASLAFLPFLISFIGSLKLMRKNYSILHAFIFLTIFYTLYISFFGYPRDDAFQAAYVWLGFSLWLILDKPKLCIK